MLSFAGDVTTIPRKQIGTALFDRVRRSLERGRLSEGLHDLIGGLEQIRNTMEPGEWLAAAPGLREDRALSEVIYEDPLTRRAFDKPRGYAGDAVMMDYVYGVHGGRQAAAQASPTGAAILRHIQQRPAGQGVRHRREHIAEAIDEIAGETPQPAILAVAAGHLREAELSTAVTSGRVGTFVALDADADSLREVSAQYSRFGVQTTHASVRHLLARKVATGSFDLVYAAGLYDYLAAPVGAALTARMFELTNPGGQLLIPNFAPCCPDRGYMETFMAWNLIYRDEFDMQQLLERIPPDEIASYDIYSDPSGSIVYLRVKKRAA